MLQSFFKKRQEMAHSFKKKKNLNIVLWIIEHANQKTEIVYSFLTLGCQQCTVHLRFWVNCVKYKEVSLFKSLISNVYRVYSYTQYS